MMSRWLMSSSRASVTVVIASAVRNPDVRALAIAAGWNGTSTFTVIINSGVDVASLNIAVANIPHDTLTIVNNGRIGGVINSGDAITTTSRIKITNNGTIFGGGGQGGLGQRVTLTYRSDSVPVIGYAGGGGNGAGFNTSGTLAFLNQTAGSSGTSETYTGPTFGETPPTATGGSGGGGGAMGQSGTSGNNGLASGAYSSQVVSGPFNGAAAGRYIVGNSLVTWLANGTRLGNVA